MAQESASCMARGPNLQWQGWLASVALHAAVVTLVLAAPFDPAVDVTAPFHWDVTLVDKVVSVTDPIEAGIGGDASPPGQNQKSPVEPMPQATVKVKTVHHRDPEIMKPVEAVRTVDRQVKTRTVPVDRGEHKQYEPKDFAKYEMANDEQQAAVRQDLARKPSEIVSSESPTIATPETHRRHEMNGAESGAITTVERQQPTVSPEVLYEPLNMASVETTAIVRSGAIQHPTAIPAAELARVDAEVRPSLASPPAVSSLVGGADSDGHEEAKSVEQAGAGKGVSPEIEVSLGSGQGPSAGAAASREDNPSSMPDDSSRSESGNGSGLDYGWLKRLLWERIDRIKNYSDDAVENEWEGRVVMVATIRSDGRIEEVTVAESSGNGSLDQEAARLIARASPLELDRALGAARVRFRVPISFGLE